MDPLPASRVKRHQVWVSILLVVSAVIVVAGAFLVRTEAEVPMETSYTIFKGIEYTALSDTRPTLQSPNTTANMTTATSKTEKKAAPTQTAAAASEISTATQSQTAAAASEIPKAAPPQTAAAASEIPKAAPPQPAAASEIPKAAPPRTNSGMKTRLKPLQLTHITKTGGTTIEDLAFKKGIKWGRHSPIYLRNAGFPYHACKTCKWQGSHHIALKMFPREVVERYDWFMVVRNPYARVLSEFHCKWGGLGTWLKSFGAKGMPKTQKNLKKMNSYLQMKIRAKPRSGAHYTPMYRYYDNRTRMSIIRFEHLTTDFDTLMVKYDIPLRMSKHHNRRPESSDPITVDDFDDTTVRLIQTAYRRDFQLFGYDILNHTNAGMNR